MTRDPDTPAIRRRADGSVDTGHYMDRGRGLQAAALREALCLLIRDLRSASRTDRRPAGAPPQRAGSHPERV